MARVSLRGTAASTSSSPSLSSWPLLSNSVTFSLSRNSVIPKFTNTTILSPSKLRLLASLGKKTRASLSATMATGGKWQVVLPPALTSTLDPPLLFDGTTRMYVSYQCPYAQRACIARNCKVDIAYAPFLERFRPFSLEVKKYDITAGRLKTGSTD